MEQARLIVSRTLASDVRQRQVYVDLDGVRIASLLVDEEVSVAIGPGLHTLKLNNTLIKKVIDFEAAAGQTVQFKLANTAGRLAIPFLAVMGVAPLYLTVERVS